MQKLISISDGEGAERWSLLAQDFITVLISRFAQKRTIISGLWPASARSRLSRLSWRWIEQVAWVRVRSFGEYEVENMKWEETDGEQSRPQHFKPGQKRRRRLFDQLHEATHGTDRALTPAKAKYKHNQMFTVTWE